MRARSALVLPLVLALAGVLVAILLLRSGQSTAPVEPARVEGSAERGAESNGAAPALEDAVPVVERTAVAGEPAPEPARLADAPPPDPSLRVRVVDPAGAPVPGTQVRAIERLRIGFPRRELGTAETDVEGRASFEPYGIEPRSAAELELRLRPPEGWAQMEWVGPLPDGELEVELLRPTRLTGTVRLSSGEPAPRGSKLNLDWRADERRGGRVVARVRDGEYETDAELAGRVTGAGLSVSDAHYRHEDLDLALEPGAVQRADFLFQLGCTCRIAVLDDESGAPLADAMVRLHHPRTGTTDAEGRLEVRDALGAGRSVLVRVEHANHPPFRTLVDCPYPAQDLDLTFRLPRGFDVSGIVVDSAGAPLSEVDVICKRTFGARFGGGSRFDDVGRITRTDAGGRFRLHGFAAGEGYDLVFRRDIEFFVRERISFPEAESRELWVVHDPIAATGRVVDSAGEPVAELDVRADGAWSVGAALARTDASGHFTLEGLFPGEWYAWAEFGPPIDEERRRVRERAGSAFEVSATGAARIEIRLPPPRARPRERAPLVLRVFDRASGAPIEALDGLFLVGIDTTESIGTSGAASAEGVWLAPFEGEYELLVRAYGYRPGRLTFTLEAGDAPLELELALEPER